MIDVEKMVKAINALDLKHRKGFYPSEGIGQIPDGKHFMNEAEELVEALHDLKKFNNEYYEDANGHYLIDLTGHVLEEMGDVFGTLMQIAYRLGFTFEEINQESVRKMRLRFDNAQNINLEDYGD